MAERKKSDQLMADEQMAQERKEQAREVQSERAALEERDEPVTYVVDGQRVKPNGEPVDEKK